MHPQLDKDRFNPCAELIDALEECHKNETYRKLFGICNDPKAALSKCLHETRTSNVRERILQKRDKQKGFEKKMKEMKEEEYGKDLKLRKVVDALARENEKR